ncbi:Major sperm protein [Aphelenchoides besseyi]|nr:Major sperm protein [Aphelenchoides besseyi]KAI6194903.1 Major sperm protein [Aphelenchoides besseyi]
MTVESSLLMPPNKKPPEIPPTLPLPLVSQSPEKLSLSLNPPRAWFTTLGGVSKHIICNHSCDRLALKVRCSNNHIYRVNPVYSFLESGQAHEFEVIRLQGGEARKDKLQILFTIARENDLVPSSLFGNTAKVRSLIVPIITI